LPECAPAASCADQSQCRKNALGAGFFLEIEAQARQDALVALKNLLRFFANAG
jgi:hypothetical protein